MAANGLPSPANTPKAVQRASKPTVPQQRDLVNDSLDNVSFTSEATLGMGFFASSIAEMTRTHATTHTSPNTLAFLLHHFSTTAYTTLSSNTGQKIIKQRIPGLVMQFPFLLEAVVAFSASHMSYLKQSKSGAVPSNMGIVAAWHIVRALRGYGQKISDLQGREAIKISAHQQDGLYERKGMDALVAACLILTSLFYHVSWSNHQPQLWSSLWSPARIMHSTTGHSANYSPAPAGGVPVPMPNGVVPTPLKSSPAGQSGPYSSTTSTPQCDWLTNVTGMSIVLTLAQFREHLPHSIWYPFLAEGNDMEATPEALIDSKVRSRSDPPATSQQSPSNSHSEPSFAPNEELTCTAINCLLPTPASTSLQLPHLSHLLAISRHIHRPVLRPLLTHLTNLLPLRPADLSTFSRIISFPSFFPAPTFPQLVAARDPAVLLILGYWFGMLEGVPHWWCQERGRREGRVVEAWLCALVKGWEAGGTTDGLGRGDEGELDGLWGLQTNGECEVGRDLGWGYSRKGREEELSAYSRDAEWRAAVKMAAGEFLSWRGGRGLRA